MEKLYLLALISIYFLSSCTSRNTKNEQSDLHDQQLIAYATENGNEISSKTQMVLAKNLKAAIEREGVQGALQFCNVRAYPLVDSMEIAFHANIKRASHRTRNPDDAPDPLENEIIEKYEKMMKEGKTPSVQVIARDKNITFFKPIILNDNLCLQCHGLPGKDISEENYKLIKTLYPNDNATGHVLGDLRGVWSITFKNDFIK